VGSRLARAARQVIYGEAIAPSGPVPLSAVREPGRIVVSFGNVDGALVTYSSAQAIGFEVCGKARESCRFAPATAEGNRVVVPLSPDQGDAARLRFCWGASPLCNLSDATGLPVGPFQVAIR
jgi:sialate O-acetylesterase